MPSTPILLDLDTRKFTDETGFNALNQLTGKKDSVRKYEMSILSNGIPLDLPAGTTATVGVKDPKNLGGAYLATAAATRAGWGSGSRWFFTLDLGTPELAAYMATPGITLPVTTSLEVLLTFTDGQLVPSVTIPFVIDANVI